MAQKFHDASCCSKIFQSAPASAGGNSPITRCGVPPALQRGSFAVKLSCSKRRSAGRIAWFCRPQGEPEQIRLPLNLAQTQAVLNAALANPQTATAARAAAQEVAAVVREAEQTVLEREWVEAHSNQLARELLEENGRLRLKTVISGAPLIYLSLQDVFDEVGISFDDYWRCAPLEVNMAPLPPRDLVRMLPHFREAICSGLGEEYTAKIPEMVAHVWEVLQELEGREGAQECKPKTDPRSWGVATIPSGLLTQDEVDTAWTIILFRVMQERAL